MKKLIVVISVLLVLVLSLASLCACNKTNKDVDLSDLNEKLHSSYDKWTLNVKTTFNGTDLNSSFVVENKSNSTLINYSIEYLNELSLSGDNSFTSKKTGTATIVDGKLTTTSDPTTVETLFESTKLGMSFKSAYFDNITMKDGQFTANLKDPSGFMGFVIDAENAKVQCTYNANSMTSLTVSFDKSTGGKVVYSYIFE